MSRDRRGNLDPLALPVLQVQTARKVPPDRKAYRGSLVTLALQGWPGMLALLARPDRLDRRDRRAK